MAQSLRQLRRAPGFVLFAVVILGLGIGANASIFSVLNALLLQPLPYPDGDRIVRALNRSQRFGFGQNVSGPNYKDWHDQSNSFAAFARFRGGEVALTVRDRAQFQPVYLVSEEFFSVFGLVPVAGQLPEAREYRENHAESAVISHAFWQSEFGASPTAIGQTVKFDNRLYRISAIAPPSFEFPTQAAVWVFDTPDGDRLNRTANNFRVVGRLKPGITLAQAQSEMDAIAAGLAQKYPNENKGRGVTLLPVAEEQARPYRQTLELLFAATLLLLLIACANVSSLLLARAIARQREFAVRASLGASTYHVLGQLLTESALLGLGACLAAVLFAYGITRGLIQLLPPWLPPRAGNLDRLHCLWLCRAASLTRQHALRAVSGLASLSYRHPPCPQTGRAKGFSRRILRPLPPRSGHAPNRPLAHPPVRCLAVGPFHGQPARRQPRP